MRTLQIWFLTLTLTISVASGFLCSSPKYSSALVLENGSDEDLYGEEETSTTNRRRRPLRRSPSGKKKQDLGVLEDRRKDAKERHQEALKDPTLLTSTRFADRSDISAASKRAITEVLGLQKMTEIQAKTYAAVLDGQSVLGRAKTGTGKTLAFLVPAVERLLEADLDLFKPGQNIGVIVVAPTRELAIQIADQAESLLAFHNDFNVACVYGGTKLQRDVRMLSANKLPTILVATPGRLLEHLENTRIGRRKFSSIAEETRIVVLDEADRLLDGFAKETKRILSFLPRAEKRQNLLFSATIPKKLRGFIKGGMNINFTEIDCIQGTRSLGETNLRVEQEYIRLAKMEDYVPLLLKILQHAIEEGGDNYKILVFFPACRLVRFFYQFFTIALDIPVMEIHSRMSQASRTKASQSFRTNKSNILFTSDVSARGVDYNVDLVVQYGAPAGEDAYIHRLGRTARAGRAGKGLLVLMPFESDRILGNLRSRGIAIQESNLDFLGLETSRIERARLTVRSGHAILTHGAEAASRAFLAYYAGNCNDLESRELLKHSQSFAVGVGLKEMPSIETKVASRIGIDDVSD